jgi:hypothetical protein
VREIYFILLSKDRSRILAEKSDDGYVLPTFDDAVSLNVGLEYPDDHNRWFEKKFGLEVFRRYAIDPEHQGKSFFVLESFSAKEDKRFVPIDLFDVDTKSLIERLREFYCSSFTMPWVSKTSYGEYIAWATSVIEPAGSRMIQEIRQVRNSYVSTVFQIVTDEKDFYLKIPGQVFIREIECLEAISDLADDCTPKITRVNYDLKAYLMEDMGGADLDISQDHPRVSEIVKSIARLQKRALAKPSLMTSSSIRDLGPEVLKSHCARLPELASDLLDGSSYELTGTQKSKLILECDKYYEYLSGIPNTIPPSIDHGDLRPGNIRLVGDKIVFYDWAWPAITHPFLTVCSFLYIVRRNKAIAKLRKSIVEEYLEEWKEYDTMPNLHTSFAVIENIRNFYFAVCDSIWLQELLEATGRNCSDSSSDGWAIERRRYYLHRVLVQVVDSAS